MRESKGVYTESSCRNCEFNFGTVCAGYGRMPDGTDTYGVPIEKTIQTFPSGCEDWSISFEDFCEWHDNSKLKYDTAVTLYEFLIDYSLSKGITSRNQLEKEIVNDNNISKEERDMYLTRLKNISEEAKKVFLGKGIGK